MNPHCFGCLESDESSILTDQMGLETDIAVFLDEFPEDPLSEGRRHERQTNYVL